jgi:hypothetical protein
MKQREKIKLHIQSNTNTNKNGCHSLIFVQAYKNNIFRGIIPKIASSLNHVEGNFKIKGNSEK